MGKLAGPVQPVPLNGAAKLWAEKAEDERRLSLRTMFWRTAGTIFFLWLCVSAVTFLEANACRKSLCEAVDWLPDCMLWPKQLALVLYERSLASRE